MTKIEEVARALFMRSSGNDGVNAEPGDHWAEADQDVRDYWKDLARVAIEALRVPSEAMWDAGYAALDHYLDPEHHNSRASCWVWQAMHEAALKEDEG